MRNFWKRKLGSRKFWAGAALVLIGCILCLAGQVIAGIILIGIGGLGYMVTEAMVDIAGIFNAEEDAEEEPAATDSSAEADAAEESPSAEDSGAAGSAEEDLPDLSEEAAEALMEEISTEAAEDAQDGDASETTAAEEETEITAEEKEAEA